MNPDPKLEPQDEHCCPDCGTALRHWPSLEGDPHQWQCPVCDLEASSQAAGRVGHGKLVQHAAPSDPRMRFRWLLAAAENYPSDTLLPEWLIEDLPEPIRNLLRSDLDQPRPHLGPKLSDALTNALRDQGYVIEEDSRGVRLGGDLTRRASGAGQMSPYDVIRMAADLDGGIPSPDTLKRCQKCEAIMAPRETRCAWCGSELESGGPDQT